ncbi:MAG: DUF7507 domain-containing protein [Solirubrobacteraceae bacterium]
MLGGTRRLAAVGLALLGLAAAAPVSQARAYPSATLRLTVRVAGQPGVADTGRFDVRAIGPAVTWAGNVGDGGSTGIVPVPAGTFLVAESAHRGTNAADYATAISCTNVAPGRTGSASAAATRLALVVAPGDAWDCTITNTRRYAAVALEKAGPASALAGTPVTYDLTVSNVGTVPFPLARVAVSDPQCAAPGPVLHSVNGDQSPATLDPGDRWTYECAVPTASTQTRIDNAATATATDPAGRTASAQATLSTLLTLADEQQPSTAGPVIAPVAIQSGRATLYGPRGCPVRVTTAFVKGRRVVRVTYYVDGRRVRTLSRPNRAGHFTLRFALRGLRPGVHRLAARIEFAPDSHTRTQTLRLTFVRCRGGAITPTFTG